LAKGKEAFKQEAGPAERYFQTQTREPKTYLGLEKKRTERITKDQALIVAQEDQRRDILASQSGEWEESFDADVAGGASASVMDEKAAPETAPGLDPRLFRVEVDPMQAIFLDDDKIFIYRRIVIHDKVYRQGAVLAVREFMRTLAEQYFDDQPLASFAELRFTARDHGLEMAGHESGVPVASPVFQLERVFPRPFSFLEARLACDAVPRSPGRSMLLAVSAALGGVILIGLFAIYRSARVQVDLSERRTGFVSSVTHELKTPLTNIRMYIEMLEQGMAPNPEREQEYFRILGSESARLSRLINNVLEFSRVESKTRRFDPVEGDFREVLREAADVMGEKIRQEGFALDLDTANETKFVYDREVMVQVLINLFENSLKFGRSSPERRITVALKPEGDWMNIRVADTGPGIPAHALKKVFDDFYRVDDSLTRTTQGTGIGLALVKKLAAGLGGKVTAENNRGPGCTIVISLPFKKRS
jgi:signal transduction histidine kinase